MQVTVECQGKQLQPSQVEQAFGGLYLVFHAGDSFVRVSLKPRGRNKTLVRVQDSNRKVLKRVFVNGIEVKRRSAGVVIARKFDSTLSPLPTKKRVVSVKKPMKKQPLPGPLNIPSESLVKPEDQAPHDLVSIIILSYNTLKLTRHCIAAILRKTVHPYELIVVDNGSQDRSAEWLKNEQYLTLVANQKNLGFSKANNKAIIGYTRGKYVLLLNSDAIAKRSGWLQQMVQCAEGSPLIGTVGAKLFYPNGTIQHIGGGIRGVTPFHPFDKLPANIPAANVTRDVPFNTGACLLIKRSAIAKIGLLDEEYFFGFEDVDYGLRMVESGLRNVMCHKAELIHLWAYTQRKLRTPIPHASLRTFELKWRAKLPGLAKKIKME